MISSMVTALVCCADAGRADRDLGPSLVWREEVARRVVTRLEEARDAIRERPRLLLVERDLPWAASFTRSVRGDEKTRATSIAVFAPQEFHSVEVELLQSGANAVLRLPVTRDWDKRLARLLHVAPRQDVRAPMAVEIATGDEKRITLGRTMNLSETGVLVQSPAPLHPRADVSFTLRLPGSRPVRGRARVVRASGRDCVGIEFSDLDGDGLDGIRDFVTLRQAPSPAGPC